MSDISRRQLVAGSTASGLGLSAADHVARSAAFGDGFDFSKPLDGWETESGHWTTEEVAGASQRGRPRAWRSRRRRRLALPQAVSGYGQRPIRLLLLTI